MHSPLCMVLFMCCRQQPERLLALCSGPGAQLISLLLEASKETLSRAAREPQSSSAAEWLLFLLGEVCACGRRFMLLYTALGSEPAGAAGPSVVQALLLHAAAGAAEIRETASSSSDQPPEVRAHSGSAPWPLLTSRLLPDLWAPAACACFLDASCCHRACCESMRELRTGRRHGHHPLWRAAFAAHRGRRRFCPRRRCLRCASCA